MARKVKAGQHAEIESITLLILFPSHNLFDSQDMKKEFEIFLGLPEYQGKLTGG